MGQPGGRALTAEEYSVLYQHAAGLRAGHPNVESLVAVARVYRARGAAWTAIAAAFGISADLLRDWRGAVPDSAKTPIATTPSWARTLPQRLHLPPGRSHSRTVLFVAGHAQPGGNDFASEAAEIRALVRPHGVEVVERFNIELAELRRDLDDARPAVVHLAAHTSDGGITLAVGSRPCVVDPEDVGRAFQVSAHRPVLVILACCDSTQPARRMAGNWARPAPAADTAIGWAGLVTDEQTRAFAQQFYPSLAGGSTIGSCFTDAHLSITARWPGMATPQVFGDPASTPLQRP